MRVECPECGAGGATRKLPCKCHICESQMMEADKTPFAKWWAREGFDMMMKEGISSIVVAHRACKIAWYNGMYTNRNKN